MNGQNGVAVIGAGPAMYVQTGPDGQNIYYDEQGRRVQPPANPGAPQQAQAGSGAAAAELAAPVVSGAGMAAGMSLPSAFSFSPAAAAAGSGASTAGAAGGMTLPATLDFSPGAIAGAADGAAAATEGAGLFGAMSPFIAGAGMLGAGALTAHAGYRGHKAGQDQGGGAMGGLKAGIKEAGWLNAVPVLGQAAWLGGMAGGMFGSKKGKDQRSRDSGRGRLQQLGLRDADDRGFYTLPDGTRVDLSTVGANGGPSYNLDESQFSDPEFGEDVGTLNALLGAAGGGDGKRTSDLVGEHVNAFNGRGGSRGAVKDVKSKIEAAGGGANEIKHAAAEAWKRGEITAGERDARFAATDKLYGIKNTSGGRWEQGAGLSDNERKRNDKELGNNKNATRTGPKRGR